MKVMDARGPRETGSLGSRLKASTEDPKKLELNRVFAECLEKAKVGEQKCVVFVRYHDLETMQAALEDTEVSMLVSKNTIGVTVLQVEW